MVFGHLLDLILVNIPGLNRYQTLGVLQAEKKMRDMPVLAVTAQTMPRDIECGKNISFSDYITEPFNIPYL